MSIQNALLKIKEQLTQTQNEIHRNEGRLGGLYDELRNILELPEGSSKKKIIAKANAKIKELKEQIKRDEEVLEDLVTKIKEQMEEWEDDEE